MTELRTFEKQVDGKWVILPMKDLKKGDIIRYIEGPYTVSDNATEENGIWGVWVDLDETSLYIEIDHD